MNQVLAVRQMCQKYTCSKGERGILLIYDTACFWIKNCLVCSLGMGCLNYNETGQMSSGSHGPFTKQKRCISLSISKEYILPLCYMSAWLTYTYFHPARDECQHSVSVTLSVSITEQQALAGTTKPPTTKQQALAGTTKPHTTKQQALAGTTKPSTTKQQALADTTKPPNTKQQALAVILTY